MEQAAAGTEILVSRHGKPYTRLCPAQAEGDSPAAGVLPSRPQ
jgi:antitoxin (DNA-binding transcriptional repressor) of toxin-antitoxin stability system